ncbi:MAG: YraN family protein [Lachnospiraceae bacterium]|nr:YraN family protein [Lachnospiraceae bacterium]
MNKRRTGAEYEQHAARFLEEQGMEIVATNFRCRSGEVDLIFRDGAYLVFAEVKYRTTDRYGESVEAVGIRKQRTIARVSAFFLLRNGIPQDTPIRFDVLALDAADDGMTGIRWIKDAFQVNL